MRTNNCGFCEERDPMETTFVHIANRREQQGNNVLQGLTVSSTVGTVGVIRSNLQRYLCYYTPAQLLSLLSWPSHTWFYYTGTDRAGERGTGHQVMAICPDDYQSPSTVWWVWATHTFTDRAHSKRPMLTSLISVFQSWTFQVADQPLGIVHKSLKIYKLNYYLLPYKPNFVLLGVFSFANDVFN